MRHASEDGRGDTAFVGQLDDFLGAVGAEDRDRVRVVLEADAGGGDVVGHDQVEALAGELGGGVGPQIGRLGGEADEDLPGRLARTEAGEDVGRRLEHDLRDALVLLDLALGGDHRAEVGDGGGHDDDVGRRRRAPPSPPASARRSRRRDVDAGGHGEVDGGDERDPRALGRGLGGDRVALLAAAAVGDDPHRVDRLAGAAGGDDDVEAGERAAAEHPLDRGDDRRRLGEAAGADVTAGEASRLGLDDVDAARRSVARLSCTAGCSHISVCIAGQTTTGARVASRTLVSRSVDSPAA